MDLKFCTLLCSQAFLYAWAYSCAAECDRIEGVCNEFSYGMEALQHSQAATGSRAFILRFTGECFDIARV